MVITFTEKIKILIAYDLNHILECSIFLFGCIQQKQKAYNMHT